MGVETVFIHTVIEEDVFENARQKDILRQTYESEVMSEGRKVYLCRDASTIPVNTQEGAAISMKADADQAYALYETVKKKGTVSLPSLKRIELNAAQKEKGITRRVDEEDDANEYTSYMTDNAVYMGGETPTLISYPQSAQGKEHKLLGGVPLWDLEGVFQHEFGHFVFDSVMNDDGIRFASYQEYVENNPRLHLFHTPRSSFSRIAGTPVEKPASWSFLRARTSSWAR